MNVLTYITNFRNKLILAYYNFLLGFPHILQYLLKLYK